jgi:glycosyltransferase involved in cell wall biosynthesis
VRDAHPAAELRFVGAAPPAWLQRAAASDPRVTVTGWAPDLVEVWAETDVAVCPSLTGGGLLLKVAQPMAAGRPVVTTTLGNEGVAAPGGAVAVADRPAAFAQEVLRLLEDRVHWERMAQAGRRHIAAAMNWDASMKNLEAALHAAIRAGKGHSPTRRDV